MQFYLSSSTFAKANRNGLVFFLSAYSGVSSLGDEGIETLKLFRLGREHLPDILIWPSYSLSSIPVVSKIDQRRGSRWWKGVVSNQKTSKPHDIVNWLGNFFKDKQE